MKAPVPRPSKGGAASAVRRSVLILAVVTCAGYLGILIASQAGGSIGNAARSDLLRLSRSDARGLRSQSEQKQTATIALSAVAAAPCKQASPRPACAPAVLGAARYLQNPRRFHVVTTAAGFSNHWQARVHYYWYRQQLLACERQAEGCDMGGFTRLLHSGQPDDLMDEIPTVVVDPLPASAFGSQDTSYIVLNRPYAFKQWIERVSLPERYILMCETDHLMMRPIPNLMPGDAQAAALFSYINPAEYAPIVRSLLGPISDEQLKAVPHIGNSPTFLSTANMRILAPRWYNMTMKIWRDDAAHKAWNWVLEMYGFALATFEAGQHQGMAQVANLVAHPPFDVGETHPNGQPFYLLHLTYPMRYNATGARVDSEKDAVWEFQKRKFSSRAPPRDLEPPPANVHNQLVHRVVSMINQATATIPCWDVYVEQRVVTQACRQTPTPAPVAGTSQTS